MFYNICYNIKLYKTVKGLVLTITVKHTESRSVNTIAVYFALP